MSAGRAQEDGHVHLLLGDVLDVKHGFAFKGEFFGTDGPFVVVTPGSFFEEGGFRVREDKEKRYSGEVPEGFVLEKGTLIVAMTEQAEGLLGSPALVPGDNLYLHNQRIGRIEIRRPDLADKAFIYYLFNTQGVRQQIRASATGTKVRHTAPERIRNVKVQMPSLAVQRKTAAILSAYDDLIENNVRRIQILEEMAQALYREWFVEFRYPGHGRVNLVESPLGRIPEGWEVDEVGNRFTVVLGGTPSRHRPEFWTDGEIPWINSSRVNDLRVIEPSELITRDALAASATKLMPVRTTLIAITGATLGQVSLLEIEACGNQSVVGVIDQSGAMAEFMYQTFEERSRELVALGGGSAQQHINKGDVERFEVLLPPAGLVAESRELVVPTFDLIRNLLNRNVALRRSRDLLLPRLISGDLDVSELDIVIPEAAV